MRPKPAVRYGILVTLLCGLVFASLPIKVHAKKPDPAMVPIDLLLGKVQKALSDSAQNPVSGFPPLKSVTIAAQTIVTKDAQGNLKLFFFNIGAGKTVQGTSSLTFELVPPKEAKPSNAADINFDKIDDALAKQIVAAKIAFVQLKQVTSTLSTDKVDIVIGFDTTKNITGGLDVTFTMISSAEASLTGKLTKDSQNTVTLEFGTNTN